MEVVELILFALGAINNNEYFVLQKKLYKFEAITQDFYMCHVALGTHTIYTIPQVKKIYECKKSYKLYAQLFLPSIGDSLNLRTTID